MNRFAATLLKAFIAVTVPCFVLVMSVLLIFQPWFLSYEYAKSDFPPDSYGFSQEDRRRYGTMSMTYVTAVNPGFDVGQLVNPDSTPLYNRREVAHMRDVRNVFQVVRTIWGGLIFVYLVIMALSWRRLRLLHAFMQGLSIGSMLSLVIMALIIAASLLVFDQLFDLFHRLFFSADSWLFYENEALIRLFPLKLWIDGFIAVGILAFVFSMVFLTISRDSEKKISFHNQRLRD